MCLLLIIMKVKIYDISDIENPKKVKTINIDGFFADDRGGTNNGDYIYSLGKDGYEQAILSVDISYPLDTKLAISFILPEGYEGLNYYFNYRVFFNNPLNNSFWLRWRLLTYGY